MSTEGPRTVEIAPSINDRMLLAVGAGRTELLPTEDFIRGQVEQAEITAEALTGWILFGVELCRLVIELKWTEAERAEREEWREATEEVD